MSSQKKSHGGWIQIMPVIEPGRRETLRKVKTPNSTPKPIFLASPSSISPEFSTTTAPLTPSPCRRSRTKPKIAPRPKSSYVAAPTHQQTSNKFTTRGPLSTSVHVTKTETHIAQEIPSRTLKQNISQKKTCTYFQKHPETRSSPILRDFSLDVNSQVIRSTKSFTYGFDNHKYVNNNAVAEEKHSNKLQLISGRHENIGMQFVPSQTKESKTKTSIKNSVSSLHRDNLLTNINVDGNEKMDSPLRQTKSRENKSSFESKEDDDICQTRKNLAPLSKLAHALTKSFSNTIKTKDCESRSNAEKTEDCTCESQSTSVYTSVDLVHPKVQSKNVYEIMGGVYGFDSESSLADSPSLEFSKIATPYPRLSATLFADDSPIHTNINIVPLTLEHSKVIPTKVVNESYYIDEINVPIERFDSGYLIERQKSQKKEVFNHKAKSIFQKVFGSGR
eukprot:Awhi_evm1s2969